MHPIPHCLAIIFAIATIAMAAPSEAELTAARQKAWAFERTLTKKIIDTKDWDPGAKVKPYRKEIAAFFAKLDTPADKIAATELLHGRYVYIADHQQTSQLLGPLIRDPDPAVRAEAAKAIGSNRCAKQYATELRAMLTSTAAPEVLVDIAYAMGRSQHLPFTKDLIQLTASPHQKVRLAALHELQIISPDHAYPIAKQFLTDPSEHVRASTIYGFGTFVNNHPEAADTIRQHLKDPAPFIRQRATSAMHATGDGTTTATMLDDPDHRVRYAALQTLAQLKQPQHLPAILPLLKDPDVTVRRQAIITIGTLGNPTHIPLLTPYLTDPDTQIPDNTKEAIQTITRRHRQ